MLNGDMEKVYPSAKTLVKEQVASRLHAKDATLYSFSEEAQECAQNFMGWADLASNPPYPIEDIKQFAQRVHESGIEAVVLLGEGGSTQAPMTITKYNSIDSNRIKFRTLDSDSPVRVRAILAELNPHTTLFMISSKSGTTIEPNSGLVAVRKALCESMSEEDVVKHLVAITDPGSELQKMAEREGWLKVFTGEPTVGGRYSALSVFGLVPAALVGIDLDDYIAHAIEAERACSEDSVDNPAIKLAAFLYDNYVAGRDKFSFLTPKRGRVLGLWIEQLVAESLGKEGHGILPNIECDALTLSKDQGDRTVVVYQTKTDLWDERKNFEMSLAYIDQAIPRLNFRIDNVCELSQDFVVWEYAIAMCGFLMKVCPFDQPDVASAKAATLEILSGGHTEPDFVQNELGCTPLGEIEVRLSSAMKEAKTVEKALKNLMRSIEPGDYFALNAFVPFTGEGRREALELIRHTFAKEFQMASCLEIGPRYLHSTGQLQKGGKNNGVFLIISADELKDIPLEDCKAPSLGALAKGQAEGDLKVLSERGRRCVYLHLPDNSGVTLRMLGETVAKVARSLK